MDGKRAVKRKIEKRLATKSDALPKYAGVLGDGRGNLYYGDYQNAVYVTIGNQVVVAKCPRISPTIGLKVWVGYANEERTLYQVLSTRTDDPSGGVSAGGYAPANRYRYLAKGGGQDPLWLEQRAWLPLRIGTTSPASMYVNLYEGNIWTGSELLHIPADAIDLSSHVPATSGKAALVLLSIDNTGAIVETKGSEVNLADLTPSGDRYQNAPAVPADTIEILALVRVYEGQTAIREGRAALDGSGEGFTDFIDIRGIYSGALFNPVEPLQRIALGV